MYIVTKRPELSPVSLKKVAQHLRISDENENEYLDSLILAATDYVEQYCNIKIMTTHMAMELNVKANQPVKLLFGDLKSVESVYVDDVLLDKTEYKVSYIKKSITFNESAEVVINFIVGTDDVLDVPAAIKQAILLIIGTFYEHREQQTELSLKEIPFGVENLLAKYRCF
ncbi:head-tail connector protein [Shewanella xiamenensis]|uniref:head-tail connector protein n=1 Tax=Shewanella xiamenensis TaxID=332186 RepID=UPI0021C05A38|nr:head-tail connector protein [Shewanella xiamenensis]MCT8876656.1 head-tail connector protein [Shewanella xiamenensis]